MEPIEAWADFLVWIKKQPCWKGMPRTDKQYLARAEFDRRRGKLGHIRIQTLLTRHAPERYEFQITVIIKD